MSAVSHPCPFKVPSLFPIAAALCGRLVGAPHAPLPAWRDDLITRAIAAFRSGQCEQAAQLLAYHEDSLARDPAFLNLAGVLAEAGENYDAARRFYGLSIAIDPHHAAAQQNMRRVFELTRFGRTGVPVALGDEDALPALPSDARVEASEVRTLRSSESDRLAQIAQAQH